MKTYKCLQDLLEETPHIRLATPEDNQVILDFYHQTEMKGKEQSIRYGRGENFFHFLEERCPNNLIFTLWSNDHSLQGVAVVSFKEGYIGNEKNTIGYLGDLRINLNKMLIREWRHMFSLFIEHSPSLPETHFCKFYQTVIIDNNKKAQASLVNSQIKNVSYQPLQSYKMVNIIGRIKLFSRSKFNINPANGSDKKSLIEFLSSHDSNKNFGRYWTNEIDYRLTHWKNFSINQFLIIKDKSNRIIAITSFWNPIASKQVIISKVPLMFKSLVPLLNLIPFVDLKPLPKENCPINILYLNQFIFDTSTNQIEREKILSEVINYLFKYDFSMLAYCDFQCSNLLKNNLNFISHKVAMSMYTVHYIDESNQIRNPIPELTDLEPGFDMALV
jgi:hypothetical protein